ncbi:MAG: hypothetical protein A2687_04125 [Candidatus Levybacteria bacterium RIFCSPHIGHO2_01_FULL_38_26]|nr:MAG: hypothetical protein A2687_04125 [Candidatus Levybacteria bacterium RIFCSPHIGHO2_01_FULL_38_26]
MIIRSGIDLVYLPLFKKSLKNGGENFLRRVYFEEELINNDPTRLAGIFAAKEAVIKALSLSTDSWLEILITYKSNGSPEVQIQNSLQFGGQAKFKAQNSALSITHQGAYTIAQFVAILE